MYAGKEEAAARAELEGLNSRMASLKAELSAAGKGQRTGDAATLPNKIAELTALKAAGLYKTFAERIQTRGLGLHLRQTRRHRVQFALCIIAGQLDLLRLLGLQAAQFQDFALLHAELNGKAGQ